jgi:hypothetical protein
MITGRARRGKLDIANPGSPSLRMPINETWHREHPMPTRASLAQRVAWHQAHASHCGCRPIPPDIMIEIDRLERSRGKKTYRPR